MVGVDPTVLVAQKPEAAGTVSTLLLLESDTGAEAPAALVYVADTVTGELHAAPVPVTNSRVFDVVVENS
jgi:hypothetical protein